MLSVTKFIVNNGRDAWKTDINCFFFFTITNCQIVCSCSLTHGINYKFMCLSAYWQYSFANERARISAVIVKNAFVFPRFAKISYRAGKSASIFLFFENLTIKFFRGEKGPFFEECVRLFSSAFCYSQIPRKVFWLSNVVVEPGGTLI